MYTGNLGAESRPGSGSESKLGQIHGLKVNVFGSTILDGNGIICYRIFVHADQNRNLPGVGTRTQGYRSRPALFWIHIH